ncbi:YeeE/YedE thiosulfate transporter family protein [Desulfosediminicola flagellatus]|uniref:YeeE/YedE thiosulfate transporter family protein n=1 Tax=Desulfosediminicola flagellatus TaxID=2569541 RepID=UPI0010ABE93E|nr:YeeE/YedE thiosulfate transporter family protein [Desulfosediminicola flagellatus]
METSQHTPYMNPYLAGFLLGILLLASFLLLGVGLGASAFLARVGATAELFLAEQHTLAGEYFGAYGKNPMQYYLVYMFAGIVIGAFFSALLSGRIEPTLEKGKSFSVSGRIGLAVAGGILVGFASRLAGGCTSGQALTGAAQFATGSYFFLACVFIGGYATAYLVRRQWHD